MPLRATSVRARRAIVSVVLLALALAQTLGMAHRLVHRAPAVHASTSVGAPAAPGWLKALYRGHSTEQGCELYDQLSHADLLQVEIAAPVHVHAVETCVPAPMALLAAAAPTGFHARGPPRLI
jgi:hypothetical protein